MKVLVTGGLGYIGSHTAVELHNAGHVPVIIDDLSNSRIDFLHRIQKITGTSIPFYQNDVCDKDALRKIFTEHPDIKSVIHFAAFKAVGDSVKWPLKYYRTNLDALLSLVEVMEERNIPGLVFSSSCSVYGDSKVLPVTEETPRVKAESPYANTKKICEDILTDNSWVTNMSTIILRYFNPIGAHESALIGEYPLGVPTNLVPYITQAAAGIREKIVVHGTDYDTPDGTCIRDYIHVVDLAKAHIRAVERLESSGVKLEVFNVGTGTGSSVLECLKTFEEVNSLKLNYEMGPRRAGDVVKVWADTSKANKVLGWKAERDLKDMMRSAWAWQKNLGSGSF